MRRCIGAFLGWCVVCGIGLGDAHAADLPDVVRLQDGGIVRGTIVEYVPRDHVRIVLPDGTERRFAGSDVSYAGSAAGEVSPPPVVEVAPAPSDGAVAVVDAPYAPVSLTSTSGNLTFHVRNGSAHGTTSGTVLSTRGGLGVYEGTTDSETYQRLCAAPCSARIQTGPQKLALSSGDGPPVAVKEPVTLTGPSTVEGHYKSNAGVRAGGVAILVVGGISLGVAAAVLENECKGLERRCDPEMLGGVAVAGVTVVLVGAIMASMSDKATVTVTPGIPAAQWRPGMLVAEAPRNEVPAGLTATLRF